MELKWLEDVLILLEEGNFSRAAERRNVTQPAFSRRIKAMEDWIGISFVDRKRNPIQLSEAIINSETEIRTLVNRFHELKSRLRSVHDASHRLRCAAQHALSASIFPQLIQFAEARFDHTTYRLRSVNKDDCISCFLRSEVDFMLIYETKQMTTDLPEGTYKKILLGQDKLIPVVGGQLIPAIQQSNNPPRAIPYIAYPDTSFFGKVILSSDFLLKAQSFHLDWACESAFSTGVKEMALSGIGMAWLPYRLVAKELGDRRLLDMAETFGQFRLDICVYVNKRSQNPSLTHFSEAFAEYRKLNSDRPIHSG